MRFIQKVVNFLFVNLEVGTVHRKLFLAQIAFFLAKIEKQSNCSWHNSFVITDFNVSYGLTLIIYKVLVALHGVSLARARLSISKESRVVAIYNVLHEIANVASFEHLILSDILVKYIVEIAVFVLTGPLIIGIYDVITLVNLQVIESFSLSFYFKFKRRA